MADPIPTCLGCGYPLDPSLSGKCPECGRVFDWSNRDSIGPRNFAHIDLVKKVAASKPSNVIAVALGLFLLFIVFHGSGPNGFVGERTAMFLYFTLFPLTVVPWFIWFLLHIMARGELKDKGHSQPPWSWKWLGVPVVFVVCVSLLFNGVGFHLRWEFAKDDFTNLVKSGAPLMPYQQVSTFELDRNVTQLRSNKVFIPLKEWWIESGGLYYGYDELEIKEQFKVDLGDGWWMGWTSD